MKTIVLSALAVLFSSTVCLAQPKKALLIIDVQENLVDPDSKLHIDTCGIDSFFANLNHSIAQYQANDQFVLYVVNEWSNPLKNSFTGNVCKKGGEGVGPDKRLKVINNRVYSKSKPNSLTNKELLSFLKDNQVSDVCVAGLLAEGCVKATVKGLRKEKFNVIVVEDALGSKNNKNKSATMEYFRRNDVKTIPAKEI